MSHSKNLCILYAGVIILMLSSTAYLVNFIYFQFPGINYFPKSTSSIALILIFIYLGCYFQFGRVGHLTQIIKEVIYFFLVICVIIFATNAVQYTPFPPIDKYIVNFELKIGIYLPKLMGWAGRIPYAQSVLNAAYNILILELSLIPLIMIATRQIPQMREFYFLLFVSTIIGFSFYYFFPTTAPASVLSSPLFTSQQQATGLKFFELHQSIPPSTDDGGMISLPSFHMIWAWFCTYLCRNSMIGLTILIPINSLLVMACVYLGWHYVSDIVGSVIVIALSHLIFAHCCKKRTTY